VKNLAGVRHAKGEDEEKKEAWSIADFEFRIADLWEEIRNP
jgi:hypothetical protein